MRPLAVPVSLNLSAAAPCVPGLLQNAKTPAVAPQTFKRLRKRRAPLQNDFVVPIKQKKQVPIKNRKKTVDKKPFFVYTNQALSA